MKKYFQYCLVILVSTLLFSCHNKTELAPALEANWREIPIHSASLLQNIYISGNDLFVVSEKELFRMDQNNQLLETKSFQQAANKNFMPVFTDHILARGSMLEGQNYLEFHLLNNKEAFHSIDLSKLHPQVNFHFPYVHNYLCAFNENNDFLIVLYTSPKEGQTWLLLPFYFVFHIELANNNTTFEKITLIKSGQLPSNPASFLSTVTSINNQFYINYGYAYKTNADYELTPLFSNWNIKSFLQVDDLIYGFGHTQSQESKLYYSMDQGQSWQEKPALFEATLAESMDSLLVVRIGSQFMISDNALGKLSDIKYEKNLKMHEQNFFKKYNDRYYTNSVNRLYVGDSLVSR